jgi:hypothetical protein
MRRELNIGTKIHTRIIAIDEKGVGNANHKYHIESQVRECLDDERRVFSQVKFQKGAIKESGVNGCHNEDLIAIVIDRLEGFQSGDYACKENQMALDKLTEALLWLRKRTMDRENRGVEGTLYEYTPNNISNK